MRNQCASTRVFVHGSLGQENVAKIGVLVLQVTKKKSGFSHPCAGSYKFSTVKYSEFTMRV
jgi:hypothetical protein